MEHLVLTPTGKKCLQSLLQVWLNFDLALSKVPIVQRLEQERLSLEDYQHLLVNLRQQVIEGARWITRGASSFEREFVDVRSNIISHAKEEHKDYLLLEKDYVATGGDLVVIQSGSKNVGTEALHSFLMYRASLPNPIDLVGARWIIEGLGNKMATKWSKAIDNQFSFDRSISTFMSFHGKNDEKHMAELYELIDRVCQSEKDVTAITQSAKVVAKLYQLQLEEVDNHQ